MKILITGCNGQLGWELQQTAPSNIEIKYCDRQSLDITKPKTVYDEFTNGQSMFNVLSFLIL